MPHHIQHHCRCLTLKRGHHTTPPLANTIVQKQNTTAKNTSFNRLCFLGFYLETFFQKVRKNLNSRGNISENTF